MRASEKVKKLPTPPGVVATLAIIVMCCMFISLRYNVLVNHIGVGYN
jgi:hypothetical protein